MVESIKSDVISVGVSIGRGIFQKYFTPTAFKKFDRDHNIDDIIVGLFGEYPEALKVLEQAGPALQEKITKQNALNVLLGKPRVDFERFIANELGGTQSPAYELFRVFLSRMEMHEQEEKERVFELIEDDERLSRDDYLFVLELIAYDRCEYKDFQKLYKFIRDTQFEEELILSQLGSLKRTRFMRGFVALIKERGSPEAKKILSGFL